MIKPPSQKAEAEEEPPNVQDTADGPKGSLPKSVLSSGRMAGRAETTASRSSAGSARSGGLSTPSSAPGS